MNINADLGEGAGHDEEILTDVDSANICCGLHAGSATLAIQTASRCRQMGVEIGAHPGYDDRVNYGRNAVRLSAKDLGALVRFQVAALVAVAPVAYMKPHGALYHRCQNDNHSAREVINVCGELGVAILAQPRFALIEEAYRVGVRAFREGFADRGYLPDGQLVPRGQNGALLDPESAVHQALRLARSAEFDSICVHGDSPNAPETTHRIREAFKREGIETSALIARSATYKL